VSSIAVIHILCEANPSQRTSVVNGFLMLIVFVDRIVS